MDIKIAREKLKEMCQIEEKLFAMMTSDKLILHEEDLKIITKKIFEVSSMILQLTALVEEAKKRGNDE